MLYGSPYNAKSAHGQSEIQEHNRALAMLPDTILGFMLPTEAEENFSADPPIQR